MCMDLTVFYNFNWVFSTTQESLVTLFLQGPVQPASTVHRNPSCPTAHSDSHHPCMEPLRCLPFLRLSATVMFFFAVKFNHVIQVLLLVFLSAHQPPCAWQAVILGRHIAIVVQERQQKRKWEELIGWPRWLILDENSRCWPKVECEIVTQSTIRFVFHLPPFLLSLLLPLFAWRLRVYWIEFFDFHSLRTECNQTTAPSATLHQISSLKCFAKWLRSLLRKLFELFQKYEMSRPSQLGSVLCVCSSREMRRVGIRGNSREKIPAQGAFAIGFQNGAFRSPSSQQAS